MKKVKITLLIILGLISLVGFAYLVFSILKPKVAGIYIETTPLATVFIDGVEVGRTPYPKNLKPGEIVVKLVPDSIDKPLVPYETKIDLVQGVKTVIRREFGESEETSSGEIISFEKVDKDQVSLAVVSIPDSVELIIDGFERAFTPHRTTSIMPGPHQLILRMDGYQERKIDIKTYQGYKLIAIVKLAKKSGGDEEMVGNIEEIVKEEDIKNKVKILSTPTGFLRVRNEPSISGKEIGTVEPGNEYELLEVDEKTGWYKIKFVNEKTGDESEGWITNQYAEKIELVSVTPSQVLTPTP